ncbi:MAG TPA: methyltransferase domain-containing protein [Gemmatimonadaceae bacterium]|nr:methyltransferase domain-containing protein [Gemmatimonadaceae bacterium]
MTAPVNLYDSHYDQVNADVYQEIRRATYGEDLGQASWITAQECRQFCDRLGIRPEHRLLEVACGSGGVATRIAEITGAEVVGVDINSFAIEAAQRRAAPPGARVRPQFMLADADRPLPFPDRSFDFVFCNDSINHFRDRLNVLRDWRRLLRPGGRCLYTDPVVVTGLVSNAELAARSSIGFFLFSAVGANDRVIAQSGMRLAQSVDVTEGLVLTSARWLDARRARREALTELEGEPTFEELQVFLGAVRTLGDERRLSRIAFVGQRLEDVV